MERDRWLVGHDSSGKDAVGSSMLTLLAQVSRVLASSLDYKVTLVEVAALIAGTIADECVIAIDDGDPPTVVATGNPPVAEILPPSRIFAGSQRPTTPYPVGGGLIEGLGRYLDLPIEAHQRFYGVLRLVELRADAAREDVLTVAEDIALRIAVAVDAAHVHARGRAAADALQRALLPEALPACGAYAYHAAYVPAKTESIVGGDWYDAFRLPDGRVAFSIGDVAGHGLHAATIMGEVRQALRASAFDPKSPAAVLERANAVMNMREQPVMVTAIFGIYDPTTSILTYATAGHPSPILGLRDGWVSVLPTAGMPLGIGTDFESFDWTFSLPPGSLFALYTDGLIEYARDVIAGEAALLGAVASEIVSLTRNPAQSLLKRIFDNQRNTDDVATLTLSVADAAASKRLDLTCSAIPLAAPLVRHALVDFANRNELAETTRFELITTIGEAVANSAEHAYQNVPGLVRVCVENECGALCVTVEDQGRWKPSPRRDERGRGLSLMRALSQGLQIRSGANGTVIKLTIPLSPERGMTSWPSRLP